MLPRNRMRWNGGTMHAAETTVIPLSFQWYDFAFWTTCSWAMYDNKSSNGFYLRHRWPPHHSVESCCAKSWISWTVRCCAAIAGKGAALDNCFGFVDGTVRPISKPGEQQGIVYDGHKKVHALKFQPVAVPNGLISNMDSPVGMLLLQNI